MQNTNFRAMILLTGFVSAASAVPVVGVRPAFAQQVATDKPLLHSLFTDNAVLQRDRSIPVWGWTTPGNAVKVKLDKKSFSAQADMTGRWLVHIGPYPAGGPHTLTVTTGNTTVSRQNILFGDVWLCSGQSNMEMGMGMINDSDREIAAANYPDIRLFTVARDVSVVPRNNVQGQWAVCSPSSIKNGAWNGFSAVAYFFGRKLHQELKVPIGLLQCSWGGTEAESWISPAWLGTIPDFKTQVAQVNVAAKNVDVPFETQVDAWVAKQNLAATQNHSAVGIDDSQWDSITAPGDWEASNVAALHGFDGIAWYRREINVPASWAGKELIFHSGDIDDLDITSWNGHTIGTTNGWNSQRTYKIPGDQVKAGRNVLAIRVLDTGGQGGLVGAAADFRLDSSTGESLPLAGDWKIKPNILVGDQASSPLKLQIDNSHVVTIIYNGMVAPLGPFGIKGAIWYQGENNAARPEQYSRLLPVLVRNWRAQFQQTFPFHIVQLAGFMAPDESPRDDDWPRLRAAQAKTARTEPKTDIVMTYDIGDANDIHPKNKQDVGLRLALAALANDYSQKVEYTGPTLKSVYRDGDKVDVAFDHTSGGLKFTGKTNHLFALAGTDRNWFWAMPQIEGNKVTLISPPVEKPKYIRYAWSNMPLGALYNGTKLPTPPFEKDWPACNGDLRDDMPDRAS